MGIWKHSHRFSIDVPEEFRISLGEGDTSCTNHSEYAKSVGLLNLYLKHEFENPTGSHKDRSLSFQISAYLAQGKSEFVISSSGNAAISAAALCQKTDAILHVFLSPKILESKVMRLKSVLKERGEIDMSRLEDGQEYSFGNVIIHIHDRAKTHAFQFAKERNMVFLRGSTDDLAIEGFKTIAFELFEQAGDADSIFIPCSSGTSTSGVYEGYKQIRESLQESDEWEVPQIHLVQTTKVNPIASEFDKNFENTDASIAEAIVDRVAHRKKEVIQHIIDTDGFGWVVDDDEIKQGLVVLKSWGVECSPEGGMTIAAVLKAKKRGWSFNSPVCLLTGK